MKPRAWLTTLSIKFGPLCFFCEKNAASTIDHLYPRTLGGETVMGNLVPACGPCNGVKGERLPTAEEVEKFQRIRGSKGMFPDENTIKQKIADKERRIRENEARMQALSDAARAARGLGPKPIKKTPPARPRWRSRAVDPRDVVTQKVRSRGAPAKKKVQPNYSLPTISILKALAPKPSDGLPTTSNRMEFVPLPEGGMKRVS